MALSDYYSAAATAAANATDRESARLKAVAEQNQMVANAIQQQIDQQRQAGRFSAGVKPRSTTPTATPELPGVQTVGGPVVDRPIKSAPAPMPAAGLRTGPSGAAITPNMQAAISAVPSNIPPLKAAPTPAAPTPAATTVGNAPVNDGTNLSGWDIHSRGINTDRALTEIGYTIQSMQNDLGPFNAVGDFFLKPSDLSKVQATRAYQQQMFDWFKSKRDFFIANPGALQEAKKDPIGFYNANKGAEPAAAPAAAQPAATTTAAEQPAATIAGVTPPAATTVAETETTTAEQPAGLEPPAPAPEPGVPEVLTNSKLRAAIPDAALEYQSQRLAADRQDLLNFYNRQAEQIRASAAAADQRRNAQYEDLIAQARAASTAGNTGYAQTLLNQADALLAEAETSASTVQQSMDALWVGARETMATNEAAILSNQAVIAEREFSQFNNPSRMLTMMEAYGYQGAELEDAGGGKFRLRMPSTEPGQFYYIPDDSGKPVSFTKQSFVEYFMGTISEDFRIKAQQSRATAAAEAQKFQQELDKETFKNFLEIDKYLKTEGATPDKYDTKLDETTGTVTYTPKDPMSGLPIIRVAPSLAADGQTTVYKPQVIDVTGLLNR